MNVAVIGAGHVGLTTAAGFARLGHTVSCADVNPALVDELSAGTVRLAEAGLPELVREQLDTGRLRFTTSLPDAVASADVAIVCVPTPSDERGRADLTAVRAVVEGIRDHLRSGAIVVMKSTVPVGTSGLVAELLGPREDVRVASIPEFLREGRGVEDFLHPDRIVVGCADPEVAQRLAGLYDGVEAPIHVMGHASAELTKQSANAFLATKVSFVNFIAALCDASGADVTEVVRGLSDDPRIGGAYLRAGPGYGGSCLPKDTSALFHIARDLGVDSTFLGAILEVNDAQPRWIVDLVERSLERDLAGARIGVLGLTFKADSDVLTDSPAVTIARELVDRGGEVTAYDPGVRDPLDRFSLAAQSADVAIDADALVVLTDWSEFAALDLEKLRELMRTPLIVDARNCFDAGAARAAGFRYVGVGRPDTMPTS